MPTYKIKHTTEKGEGRRKNWRIFIDGNDGDLDKIKAVRYQLPEDFPRPVVQSRDRPEKFSADVSGHSNPVIYATIEVPGKPAAIVGHTLTDDNDNDGTTVNIS